MTDKEKLDLIRKLALNLSPIDFTNQEIGLGAGHAMIVAVELITDMPGEEIPEILVARKDSTTSREWSEE